jgi:lipoate-protein ligase B
MPFAAPRIARASRLRGADMTLSGFQKMTGIMTGNAVSAVKSKACCASHLGLVGFAAASELQNNLVQQRLAGEIPDTVLFLQHQPVITIGAFGGEQNIVVPHSVLKTKRIPVIKTDRGGDVTYHCPGQLVCYPILDLKDRGHDVHQYVHDLEEVVLRTLDDYSIKAHRDPDYPGIWVGQEKICAMGIRVVHWITKHGFALNINNDLTPFSYINPCGITGKGVTSMRQILGRELGINDVIDCTIRHFSAILGVNVFEGTSVL